MKAFLIVFLTLLVIAAVIAGAGYWYVSRLFQESPPPVAAEQTRRSIATGDLVGYVDAGGTHAWLGIPFAKPPVGDLRWRAPRAPDAWQGVRNALTVGAQCPQRGLGGGENASGTGEEDCLYLNVWAPGDLAGQGRRVPVMFWIHGGGNHIGAGGTSIYNGANLASTHEVVVVTINYRLGPLGWLAHPGLRDGVDPADGSGNYGTLDIIAALHWVRMNVAQFGGDPGNITIFGESAGGWNVLTMMVSPLAAGLYHKAIVESGGVALMPLSDAENYFDDDVPGNRMSSRELVNNLLLHDGLMLQDGKAADRAAAEAAQNAMTDAEVAEYLRSKTSDEILLAQSGGGFGAPTIFGDGHVLPKDTQIDALFTDADNYNVTPVILGTNRDEMKLFLAFSPASTERLFGIPYKVRDGASYHRAAAYSSDAWKVRGVDSLAAPLRDTQGPTVFAYRFDWDELRTLLTLDLAELLGAAHAFELPFVFGNFDIVDRLMIIEDDVIPARDRLSKAMMSYWAEFAHTGNPGRGRDGAEVQWTTWDNDESSNRLMILDSENDGGIRMSSLHLTIEDLRQRLLADTSFDNQQDHCQAYKQLLQGESFVRSEYKTLGREGCSAE